MYKGLYDQFQHWFHDNRGQVYFYSDPHFADEEMKYIRKNYIGDEEQVKRINSKIGKNDTLVILGDVGDVEWVKKLRGYKVLVMGNHDAGASNYKREKTLTNTGLDCPICNNTVNWLDDDAWCPTCRKWVSPSGIARYNDNHLFDEVYEGAHIISEKIILSHEPVDFPYALNIHGHDHSDWSGKNDDMHWNVCAEHIDYTPICLKQIIESGRLKKIQTIHRETIDEATERKKKRKDKVHPCREAMEDAYKEHLDIYG